jgi:1-acyl-sn-glycerol-3-phosphate acyltransferase
MNRLSQYLCFPVVWLLTKPFFSVEFRNATGFKTVIGKPAIIIANHISFYDHFLLRLNPDWTKLDVFFMGVTKFNHWYMKLMWYTGIVPLIYFFFGVFLVVPGRGIAKNLEEPKRLLGKGKHVFIFPEGSMNTEGVMQPFKSGAAVLASDTGMPALPISYKLVCEPGARKKIVITLGEVMSFAQGQDPETIKTAMENRVREMLATSAVEPLTEFNALPRTTV